MKLFVLVFVVIGLMSPVIATVATWDPFIVNTVNVDQNGNGSWSVDKTTWTTQAWVWSQNHQADYWSGWDQYFHPSVDGAEGGIVFKFQTSVTASVNVAISAFYGMSNWAGQKVTLYYSDNNDWGTLSPMSGSLWPGNMEFDSNTNWQMLESYHVWSPIALNDTLDGNVYSSDGVFYVRVDLTTLSSVPSWVGLYNLSLITTDVPALPEVYVTETDGITEVSESGVTDTYSICLSSQPVSQVVVTAAVNVTDPQIQISNGGAYSDQAQLTFTASNWDSPQVITVAAIDDAANEFTAWPPTPHTSVITHSISTSDAGYSGLEVNSVTAKITDNDWPCGTAGMEYMGSDVNKDCYVDLDDIKMMAGNWLECNVPGMAGCDVNQ